MIAQAFGFDQVQLDGVIGLCAACLGQACAGFFIALLGEQQFGLALLGRQIVVARADQGVFLQSSVVVAQRFVSAAEVVVRGIDMAAAFDQLFEVDDGFFPGFSFQAHQRQAWLSR